MTATWNPSAKGASITLSGGNLIASQTANSANAVKGTLSQHTGKWYFEVEVGISGGGDTYLGLGNATASTSAFAGSDANSWGYKSSDGKLYHSGTGGTAITTFSSGDTMGIAWDADAGKFWISKNGTFVGSGNPAAGTNPTGTSVSGTLFPMMSMIVTSGTSSGLADFGNIGFNTSPPSGFNAWIFTGPTTWNPSDKASTATLSNGNLTLTDASGVWSLARTTDNHSSGKWYWETTQGGGGTISEGIENGTAGFSNGPLPSFSSAYAYQDAAGGVVGGAVGNISVSFLSTVGTVFMHALDLDNGKYWAGANGTWWNSGNPSAGTSPLATGISGTWYAAGSPGATSTSLTGNWGGSGFTYTIPTGFSSWGPLGTVSGSLASTEAKDAYVSSGSVAWHTVIAATEAKDTAALGATAASGISGTIGATESKDTLAVGATEFITISGSIAVTEHADTTNIGLTDFSTITASISVTEAKDSFTLSGNTSVPIEVAIGATETKDKTLIIGSPIDGGSTKILTVGYTGAQGQVTTSPDGSSWTNDANLGTYPLNAVKQSGPGGYWVIVGGNTPSGGKIWKSLDGDSWTAQTAPGGSGPFTGVHYDAGQWVAVTSLGQIYTSADGATWAFQFNASPFSLWAVTYGLGLWVVVGNNGKIYSSPDGINWTLRTSGITTALRSVTWNGSLFVTSGQLGKIATSPNGVTWTVQSNSNTNQGNSIAYGDGTWVIATGLGNTTQITKSTNAIAWTTSTLSTTAGLLNGVTWDGTQFVAVGFKSFSAAPPVFTSPNGITWTQQTYSGNHQLLAIDAGMTPSTGYVFGSYHITEHADTSFIGVTVIQTAMGTISATEGKDSLVFHGISSATDPGTFHLVEPSDSAHINCFEVLTAKVVIIIDTKENADNLRIHGSSPIHGTISATETKDSASFTQTGGPTVAIKILNTTFDKIVTGGVELFNGGTINIYEGNQPNDPSDPPTGTLVVAVTLPNPAFTTVSDGSAVMTGIWNGFAVNNGICGWFRMSSPGGADSIDGTVTTAIGNGDLVMTATNVNAGDPIVVTAATFGMTLVNS